VSEPTVDRVVFFAFSPKPLVTQFDTSFAKTTAVRLGVAPP